MPELNQNFIKGRMNKDLDERLVPNGEYREALNIEASTSEASEVGTVQTLVGNAVKGTSLRGSCVGSIADEKTNKIYYLVSSPDNFKDAIIEYNSEDETEKPVLVDVYNIEIPLTLAAGSNDHIVLSPLEAVNIRVGMVVTGTLGGVAYSVNDGVYISRITLSGLNYNVYLEQVVTNNILNNFPSFVGDQITFTSERVLNFEKDDYVTGINVIDNFLFWTDNKNEPKQIKIDRCIDGTVDISTHTKLKIQDPTTFSLQTINYGLGKDFIEESHITVVKKSPLTPPYLQMFDTKADRVNGVYAEFASHDFTELNNFNVLVNVSPGEMLIAKQTVSNVSFKEGDVVLATNDSLVGQGQSSFSSHEVRLEVVGVYAGQFNQYDFKVLSITSTPLTAPTATSPIPWYLLLDQEKAMFEFKFPRFGYRYKYADGEYSSFSPFSEPAFMPGSFDYLPQKGYNLGMVNNLRRLKIQDFVLEPSLLPKGVVAIDILYKESNSPNVYTVKTILYGDEEWNVTTGSGGLMKGSTLIESEMIYAILPSNQLLRPWDNVPRKALGQEMSGNRIIYANYLQNYNLIDINNKEIKIDVVGGLESAVVGALEIKTPGKSVKSLRTYQLGIVYRDEYGRETPVLAPSSIDDNTEATVGTIEVPKGMADNYNRLTARIKNKPPKWANTYKFFIKETSNEYYNLAMDRWYEAEDGNVWISFPSSERNKVQEDTFLILKKQHNNDIFVAEPSRYKVLSIEDNAPQFVKRSTNSFGSVIMTWATGGEPLEDYTQLYADATKFGNSSLAESIGKTNLRLRIKNSANSSNWYDINGIQLSVQGNYYLINLDKKLEEEINVFLDSSGALITGLELEIVQNVFKEKPEFDGRFFVKIYKDVALQTNILTTLDSEPQFAIKSAKHHFFLNNSSGRDAEWWQEAWNRTDFFIDAESRGLVGQGTAVPLPGYLNHILNPSLNLNSSFYAGLGGNFPADNGYGIGGNRPYSLSNSGSMHFTGAATSLSWQGAAMEISVSKLEEGISYKEAEAFSLINTNQYTFWNQLKAVGTLFRWQNDPDGVIYKVIGYADSADPGPPNSGTNGKGILNYSSANVLSNHWDEDDNKSRRLYLYFTTSDEGWTKDSQLTTVGSNGIANTDVDKYYSNPAFANKLPHWHPNSNWTQLPPMMFDPTRNFSTGVDTGSIGHSEINHALTTSELGVSSVLLTQSIKNSYTNTIEIVDIFYDEDSSYSSTNPAIWETEPKENIDLDIYYESSQAFPLELNADTNESFASYGSTVTVENPSSTLAVGTTVTDWSDNTVSLSNSNALLNQSDILAFKRADGSVTRARISSLSGTNNVILDRRIWDKKHTLSWFNCYSFGNGVESNRVRDDYNAVMIDKGPKASMTLAEQYKEERRSNGLIYSGIYNSISGVNNLNQFIQAEPITKDLNPRFGSIQKLHSRDTDIVALCEDKVLKILSEKDAVFNADGNTNLTATNKVLGQVIPYTGEYGISKNPESFAYQAYRSYFSDKARGVVLRLSKDGLTPISEHGMKDFFADHLTHAKKIVGSYDDKKSSYNISLKSLTSNPRDITVSTTSLVLNTTEVPSNGNALGNWFRYGGLVDNWAKAIETGAFNNNITNPNGAAAGTVGSITPHERGWAGIAAGTPTHPTGVEHGKPSPNGTNPTLNNPIILYFDKITSGHVLAPAFDSTSNWNSLISALNTNGANNVYLYQTYLHANYPSLASNVNVFQSFPNNWSYVHQPETVYSIESITYDAVSGTYKVVLNWLVGYSAFQDFNTFKWSLTGPFDETTGLNSNQASGNSSKETESYTVTFSDKTNGWVSFKSWIIDSGLSLNNKFYTLPDSTYHTNDSSGYLWQHRSSNLRNNFYGEQKASEVEFYLNGSPNVVKSLLSLSYSGTKSRVLKNILTGTDINNNNQFDEEYYNNFDHNGWFASSIETDLQSGNELEFKEKEGKWFAAMRGEKTYFNSSSDTNIDMSEFSFQGIGKASSITMSNDNGGPIDPEPTAFTITIKDDPSDH